MERKITEFEEQVVRLCHHDFEGLIQTEAAKRLNVSQKHISKTLTRLKKKAPQLFPILTEEETYIQTCIVDEGLTHKQTAKLLNVSEKTVDEIILTLKAKGVCFEKPHKIMRYENWMDDDIRYKF